MVHWCQPLGYVVVHDINVLSVVHLIDIDGFVFGLWQGALCEKGGNKIYHQWSLLLQPGLDHQRWGGRRCSFCFNQRV